MKIFIDSADVSEIRDANDMGVIDQPLAGRQDRPQVRRRHQRNLRDC